MISIQALSLGFWNLLCLLDILPFLLNQPMVHSRDDSHYIRFNLMIAYVAKCNVYKIE